MHELEMLYKRRSDGKAQQWTMQIEGDKYRTKAGIHNGRLVTSTWTTAKPKNVGKANETLAEEQAEKEAKAKWKKKLDGEYHLDINNIDKPKWFKPMLAKPYDKYKDSLVLPVYVQPKLDGVRCLATPDKLQSRTGKPIVSCPHILEDLERVFTQEVFPVLRLDGELYCDRYSNDFEQIVSIVRKQKPTTRGLQIARKHMEYWVYDMPGEKPFSERWKELIWVIASWPPGISIKTVPTMECNTHAEIDQYYRQFLKQGYEGQIIRQNGPYQQKRSSLLLKRKEFLDEEFVIMGFEEGIGNRSGMVGRVVLSHDIGKTFGANIRGTHKYLTYLWQHKGQQIGKMATVRYFERTAQNVPRFPVVTAIRDYE